MNAYSKRLVSIFSFSLVSIILQGQALAANTGISAEDIARIDDARDLYQSSCAACHGFDGIPIMPGIPNFSNGERLEKADRELLVIVQDGKESETGGIAMPPWKGALNDEEILGVLNYIRVINGDPVFQDNCMSCHDNSVPPVAESIPRTVGKLNMHQGPFNLCKGTDTDNTMERQDIISVIQFLVGVSKN
jgi:mono/diheme cytochrome c family protein